MKRPVVAVVQGPNLNLLGTREPERYGATTLEALHARLVELGRELGARVDPFQSNHEGALVEHVQGLRGKAGAAIVNAAAYTHTSIALRDALLAAEVPFVEVHLTNVHAREEFRQRSLLSDIAAGVIVGLGPLGYELALRAAVDLCARRS